MELCWNRFNDLWTEFYSSYQCRYLHCDSFGSCNYKLFGSNFICYCIYDWWEGLNYNCECADRHLWYSTRSGNNIFYKDRLSRYGCDKWCDIAIQWFFDSSFNDSCWDLCYFDSTKCANIQQWFSLELYDYLYEWYTYNWKEGINNYRECAELYLRNGISSGYYFFHHF